VCVCVCVCRALLPRKTLSQELKQKHVLASNWIYVRVFLTYLVDPSSNIYIYIYI
jgi:hypothetical protein